MRDPARNAVVVCLLALTTLLMNVGGSRLWDRDEPRNGRCAVEMFQRGDWIVPTFDGQLRSHKPILLYWTQLLALSVFGISEFSLRLPSALAGCATVWLTYRIARRFLSPAAAVYAACVLATSLMFVVASRIATPDALLILCQTAAVALFIRFAFDRAEVDRDGFRRPVLRSLTVWQWCTCYAATGFAVLAKGPVGLLLPLVVIGLLQLWMQWAAADAPSASRFTRLQRLLVLAVKTGWSMRPGLALLMTVVVAGPWYAAVSWATDGAWPREFFLTHNVHRAVSPMEGHSGPGPLFYVAALLAGTFPWSLLVLPLAVALWTQRRRAQTAPPAVVLACCWIGTYVGFFSLAATKLPSYVTPCYPAVALLVGWYLEQLSAARASQRRSLAAACVVAAALGLAICTAGSFELPNVGRLGMLVPIGVLLIVAEAGAVLLWQRAPRLLAPSLIATAAGIVIVLFNAAVGQLDERRPVLDQITRTVADHRLQRVVCPSAAEPSWVFYTGGVVTDSEKVREDELAGWLTTPGEQRGAIVDADNLDELRRQVERRGYALNISSAAPKFSKPQRYVVVHSQPARLAKGRTGAGTR